LSRYPCPRDGWQLLGSRTSDGTLSTVHSREPHGWQASWVWWTVARTMRVAVGGCLCPCQSDRCRYMSLPSLWQRHVLVERQHPHRPHTRCRRHCHRHHHHHHRLHHRHLHRHRRHHLLEMRLHKWVLLRWCCSWLTLGCGCPTVAAGPQRWLHSTCTAHARIETGRWGLDRCGNEIRVYWQYPLTHKLTSSTTHSLTYSLTHSDTHTLDMLHGWLWACSTTTTTRA